MRSLPNRALMVVVSLLMIGLFNSWGFAFELQIDGDKVSVSADRVPLQELLMRVSDFGIRVQIDPELNPLKTASFKNKELQAGLKSIITPLNSAFIWKKGSGQAGAPLYDLAEIQIFKPGRKDRMVFLDKDEDDAAAQPPLENLTPDAFETKVIIKANRVFVPVMLTQNGRTIEVYLIFDTGAGSTVLHRDVADSLLLFEGTQAKGRGVGGIEIDARVARISSIKVGPYEKQDLRVAIVEYQGEKDELYHGLLGMNFLRGLKYEIDFENQVIKWGGKRDAAEGTDQPASAGEEAN